MFESKESLQPTPSASVQTTTADSDCRETRPVAPTTIGPDLLDIVGGALLGLVLMVILIP